MIDPNKVDVFRGGGRLEIKSGEIRIKDRLVQPTHGLSLDTDPSVLGRFGSSSRIKSIPNGLQIIQRGQRDTHFEIVPKLPMTLEAFQELVRQIVLE